MIFECGPKGADMQVCEYLAQELLPGVEVKSETLDDKPNLLANAATVAKTLLADGCERVLIIWDLRPAWPDTKLKPCRAAERQTLLDSLAKEGLLNAPVYLVCIEQEFESWLIADKSRLSAFLSTATRAYKFQISGPPDRVQNPKSVVMKHFKTASGKVYVDRQHAIQVMRSDQPLNWKKLRRSESFARFEAKLTT